MDGDLDERVRGGESGREVVDRVHEVLQEIADVHRGEAVLVVSHGGAICLGVATARSSRRPPEGFRLPNTGVVRMDGDGDGWSLAEPWDGALGS